MTSHPCQSLFLNEKFSDVTFIVENKSIPVHKMILAANCPYFETMLFGPITLNQMLYGPNIELENVSYKSFLEILRCVYLRKVDLCDWTPEEVKELIVLADKYQFSEMAYVIAETVNVDTQITIDVIEDVVSVAKRLNSHQLMETCVVTARKQTDFLFSNEEAFDKLPKDFIVYLIDNKVWNAADERLVYSIGNWRKTDSIKDKKLLLSKIDWKSLPAKYLEPLVRMFLDDDMDGLQVKDWTKDLKKTNSTVQRKLEVAVRRGYTVEPIDDLGSGSPYDFQLPIYK